jgi:integrase
MAHLFRPITVKPIPTGAVRYTVAVRRTVDGKPKVTRKKMAKWKGRDGEWITAELSDRVPGKCRVRSPYWWVEWYDADGMRQREKVSTSRDAATNRMGEIVRDVERQRGGLAPMSHAVTQETLASLAEEYRDHLKALGRSRKHWRDTYAQVTTVAADCGWVRVQDVNLGDWSKWVGRQMEDSKDGDGMSAETVNHYLRSLRSFFRWLMPHRLGADPLVKAKLLNADADRRLVRRTLTGDEFRKFIDSTRGSKKVRLGMEGPRRAALYLIAARTGLRAGELAGYRACDLRLDDDVPSLTATAKRAKSRRAAELPIPAEVVKELRPWLERQPAEALLWPGNWHRDDWGADMVYRDLAEAGIEPKTSEGQFDFHCLRSQYATDLARAGVPIQVAQQLLRHSTPTLTAKFYTRLHLEDLAQAADKLGRQLGQSNPKYPEILATGEGQEGGPHGPGMPGKLGKAGECEE